MSSPLEIRNDLGGGGSSQRRRRGRHSGPRPASGEEGLGGPRGGLALWTTTRSCSYGPFGSAWASSRLRLRPLAHGASRCWTGFRCTRTLRCTATTVRGSRTRRTAGLKRMARDASSIACASDSRTRQQAAQPGASRVRRVSRFDARADASLAKPLHPSPVQATAHQDQGDDPHSPQARH